MVPGFGFTFLVETFCEAGLSGGVLSVAAVSGDVAAADATSPVSAVDELPAGLSFASVLFVGVLLAEVTPAAVTRAAGSGIAGTGGTIADGAGATTGCDVEAAAVSATDSVVAEGSVEDSCAAGVITVSAGA